MSIQLFFKFQTTGRVRGSNPPVKINGLAGQGDPTRMKTRISWANRKVAGRVGQGQEFLKSRGSGRFGLGVSQISRVGSGRVSSFSSLAGRAGSGQEGFKISRVGSGLVKSTHLNFFAGRVPI